MSFMAENAGTILLLAIVSPSLVLMAVGLEAERVRIRRLERAQRDGGDGQ